MKYSTSSLVRGALLAGVASACVGIAFAATPKEQKAIVQTGTGGPEVLKLENIPVLEPAQGQVLIKVYAAAVNPVDWKMRKANMGGPPGGGAGGPPGGGAPGAGGPPGGGAPGAGGPPGGGAPGGGAGGPPGGGGAQSSTKIPGMDVAGVVEKVGPGVTKVKVGDPVFSMIGRGITGLNGGYSEYALAPESNVVAKPKNLTYAQAAGLGTAGMTGVRSVDQANVSKGQRVLITGVAGGVGSAAAQAAKAKGAYVLGTASAKHDKYLKSIGVDEPIDYTKGKFEDKAKNVDVVIDTVGSDTAERALTTLKKGGTFVSVAARGINDKCTAAGVNCPSGGPMANEGSVLSEVGKLASEGKLTVNVDKTFPLADAAKAQSYSEEGHAEGKIILLVNASEANKK